MTWKIDADVWIERDEYGFARQLRHIQSPFSDAQAKTTHDLALAYLRVVGEELGVTLEQIGFLAAHLPAATGEGEMSDTPGEQLRWWRRREMREKEKETTILILHQTHDVPVRTIQFKREPTPTRIPVPIPIPLPEFTFDTRAFFNVYGSALRIIVHKQSDGSLAVTGATSTLRHNFNFAHAAALATSPRHLMLPDVLRRPKKKAGVADTTDSESGSSRAPWVAKMTPEILANILTELGEDPKIQPIEAEFWIYRYDPTEGARAADDIVGRLPRRRLSTELVENSDYPVSIIRHIPTNLTGEFRIGLDTPPFDVVRRVPDLTLLEAIPLMAGVDPSGLVFPTDPLSATGDISLRPNQPSGKLNRARSAVRLPRLQRTPGKPVQLRGDHVVIVQHDEVEVGTVGIDPPQVQPGQNFNYEARTNDFAAVNAYYHLDSMFQRLHDFELPFVDYAPSFSPKAEVIHRAAIRPGPGGDGRCINAQIRIRPGTVARKRKKGKKNAPGVADEEKHKLQFRFALADLSLRPGPPGIFLDEEENAHPRPLHLPVFPLGIACDVRWIWHEFGHALIAGGTGSLELPFAHSVGDALAAINCDPESVLAQSEWKEKGYRGVTFPWVNLPMRRHDREVEVGWSWTRPLGEAQGYRGDMGDMGGYRREQVLSSTLFRLYRATGGDATWRNGMPDTIRRRAAADYVTYLIARAIGSLGPAAAIPALDASVFASALMDADRGTRLFNYPGHPPRAIAQRRTGGALHKVIRWSFEKQGLYSGAPEPIDVHVDDDNNGEYGHHEKPQAKRMALWVRRQPDGKLPHQSPRRGLANYIYVRVCNRGSQTAFDAQATLRVARAAAANLSWPASSTWTAVPPQSPEAAEGDIAANDYVVLGPFVWTPTRAGTYTFLVETDAPGDRSNINQATGLPCAWATASPTKLADLVPYDNNLSVVEWQIS